MFWIEINSEYLHLDISESVRTLGICFLCIQFSIGICCPISFVLRILIFDNSFHNLTQFDYHKIENFIFIKKTESFWWIYRSMFVAATANNVFIKSGISLWGFYSSSHFSFSSYLWVCWNFLSIFLETNPYSFWICQSLRWLLIVIISVIGILLTLWTQRILFTLSVSLLPPPLYYPKYYLENVGIRSWKIISQSSLLIHYRYNFKF